VTARCRMAARTTVRKDIARNPRGWSTRRFNASTWIDQGVQLQKKVPHIGCYNTKCYARMPF